MGYGDEQLADLEATIDRVACDVVVTGTPIDLGRLIDDATPDPPRPLRARASSAQPTLADVLAPIVQRRPPAPSVSARTKVRCA